MNLVQKGEWYIVSSARAGLQSAQPFQKLDAWIITVVVVMLNFIILEEESIVIHVRICY